MKKTDEKNMWNYFLLILIFGFGMRLFLIFFYGALDSFEKWEYDVLAKNLILGRGYVIDHLEIVYHSFYSGIFYVWITTFLYYIFGEWKYAAILVMQSLFSVMMAFIIFLVARKVWNEKVGCLATFLTLSHPGLLYYDVYKLHPLSFDALSIAIMVFGILLMHEKINWKTSIIGGILLGIALMQRTTMIFFIPFAVFWIWIFVLQKEKKYHLLLIFLVGIAFVVTPWIARNYMIHDKLLMTSVSSESFWRGNAPWGVGGSYIMNGRTVLESAPDDFLIRLKSTKTELEQSELFWQTGVLLFKENPSKFISHIFKKFFYFWTFSPVSGQLYPKLYFYIYFAYYVLLVILAIFGFSNVIKNGNSVQLKALILFIFVFLTISLAHAIYYGEMKHRWALEPLIFILSSIGLIAIGSKVKLYFSQRHLVI